MKILKFGAVWCPGCLVMKPRWSEIEKDNSWLETEYHDFDEDKEVVKKYNIDNTLPVFIFLDKTNTEFLRLKGEIGKTKLIEIINNNRNS